MTRARHKKASSSRKGGLVLRSCDSPSGSPPRRNPRKPRVPPHGASLLSRHEECSLTFVEIRVLFRSLRHKLDPLDREILERAFQATLPAVQRNDSPVDFDSDEGLEAILRRELIEIACFNGVSDPETLRDILLARLPSDKHHRRGETCHDALAGSMPRKMAPLPART
jgi:hypothetical protein